MQPYFQTTEFTTAASSLLIILNHFKPEISLSKEQEFKIWRETVNLPTRGSSVYALAIYAKKQGLDLKVVVEEKEYGFPDYRFYRYTKEDIKQAEFCSNMYLKEAEKMNLMIEEREITLENLKKELNDNNILLLRINAKPIRNSKRNTSNYIAVTGYDGSKFQIIDPAFGALSIPEEMMAESFDSLESKKHRDHRMIIFKKNKNPFGTEL
ncbi:MAG: peptidase C39 family protein [Nanoarchaeota archaeon]|nr:peptidase C39 family protein [Nanoarchaeota archaeon]MBU1644518.1 peptidase C39 family protein [Nanoarchaeota archaeon]MBU1976411.1 peptidase C39 family protein [Nanoarchaeota archaeon]